MTKGKVSGALMLLIFLAAMQEALAQDCWYTVETKTGKKIMAGSDGDVALQTYEPNGTTVFHDTTLSNGWRNFWPGKKDRFQKVGRCVPYICRITISVGTSGTSPDWWPEVVRISGPNLYREFSVRHWIRRGRNTEVNNC